MRRRGELLERSFAHCYDTGGMRRVHLRGRLNIAKRLLVQAAAFNLSLLLRRHLGTAKPRGLRRAGLSSLWAHFFAWIVAWQALSRSWVSKLVTSTPGCLLSALNLDARRLA
ncbi:MAG TPA: hypothetical protein VMW75_19365 [Thermoanaerobaculia bacterium]|nr:hypothetical protein [Thermoanaerobaculia bacterium]